MMRLLRLLLAAASLLLSPHLAQAVEIRRVLAEPPTFDPARSETTRIRFQITEPALMTLHIYDGRDREVRAVRSKAPLPAGEHALSWDGKDARGRLVPAEAYIFTLTAESKGSASVEWDLGELTGTKSFRVKDVRWDPLIGRVFYVLSEPSRVLVRVGFKDNGPLLRTLVNWAVRPAGGQGEVWDGLDASGTYDVGQSASIHVVVEGFSLSANTLIVGKPGSSVALIQDLSPKAPGRERKTRPARRMVAYEHQRIEDLRDFPALLSLPDGVKPEDGGPLLTEPVDVTVDAAPDDRNLLVSERFEAVFFVDGKLISENYVPFLPTRFRLDPARFTVGAHHLTVNLRSFEGHFAIGGMPFRVAPRKSK